MMGFKTLKRGRGYKHTYKVCVCVMTDTRMLSLSGVVISRKVWFLFIISWTSKTPATKFS